MPIPSLTAAGILPAGVYVATMAEIEAAFGLSSDRRVELYRKLAEFVAFTQEFGLFESLVVDGSFVTDKLEPNDIDGVLELPPTLLAQLLSHPNAHRVLDTAGIKATYDVHLFIQPTPPVPLDRCMAFFFQHMRPEEGLTRNLRPDTMRGVLRVAL